MTFIFMVSSIDWKEFQTEISSITETSMSNLKCKHAKSFMHMKQGLILIKIPVACLHSKFHINIGKGWLVIYENSTKFCSSIKLCNDSYSLG